MKIHPASNKKFRNLSEAEIEQLKAAHNSTKDWKTIFVAGNFTPTHIHQCHFSGDIYLENFSGKDISAGAITLPAGLYNSTIKQCFIANNTAIHNVAYLFNYVIEQGSVLFNIGEMHCSANPAFGCGNNPDNTNWIELANENGARKILPFEDILPADAFLWAKFRNDNTLSDTLEKITDKNIKNNYLRYGLVAQNSVLKNVKSIQDCRIGAFCRIEGANSLKNLTIRSSAERPSFIGDDVELANGLIGYQSHVESGAKCFNFITGCNVKIELGTRIRHTFIGSNSTVACCEVSFNLIYSFHEQHHNNSFLIASTIMGQSNIAAGATIGSNHNSRAADGEIVAGRGFWPGLETDFKHNSSFATFTLIAKGSYETELNVRLPFSLISKDAAGIVQICPAFWFRYNMYALARNAWKFHTRDKRKIKRQHIETAVLAPDTLSEIMEAIDILNHAIEDATGAMTDTDIYSFNLLKDLDNVYLEGLAAKQKTPVIKPLQALWIYKNLVLLSAAQEIVENQQQDATFTPTEAKMGTWYNFGGQPIAENDVQQLINDIKVQKLKSWSDIHDRYKDLWQRYNTDKLNFSIACWLKLRNKSTENISAQEIVRLIKHSLKFNDVLLQWAIESRKKDYDNPYRQSTFLDKNEMDNVIGRFEENTFIKWMKEENNLYSQKANTVIELIKENE